MHGLAFNKSISYFTSTCIELFLDRFVVPSR